MLEAVLEAPGLIKGTGVRDKAEEKNPHEYALLALMDLLSSNKQDDFSEYIRVMKEINAAEEKSTRVREIQAELVRLKQGDIALWGNLIAQGHIYLGDRDYERLLNLKQRYCVKRQNFL